MLKLWIKPWLQRFRRPSVSFKHIGVDAIIIVFSLYLSLWLRLGEAHLDEHLTTLNYFIVLFVSLRLICLLSWGVYQSMWRYISISDALILAKAMAFSVPFLVSTTYILPNLGYLPRSLFIIDAFISSALLMAARMFRRHLYEKRSATQTPGRTLTGKVLIYGAGFNGRHLAQRLFNDPHNALELLGFLDDDPKKQNRLISGLPVLGTGAELEALLAKTAATDLVVAISHPPPQLLRQLITLGRQYKVRPQVINDLHSPTLSPKQVQLYRKLELGDLLNRPPLQNNQNDLQNLWALFKGKVVLVTGAGGSIGSEISRQVARLEPKQLLLCDHSEYNLYAIDRELRPSPEETTSPIVPLLADVKDFTAMERIFATYQPEVVLHAAAYKHVHLAECNPYATILNNILGTKNLLHLAQLFKCKRFLLISTDKAVKPGGIMGASKRVCELLTTYYGLSLNQPFSSVRFGNVLGSSGSLIPLLRQQIQDGGPITLTHPDMTRYFMLIPEAVSLVLLSSYLSHPGDISVLRMGEPLSILDLARSLLAIMGKTEDEIPIVFTGIRPGEKLHEELYLSGNEVTTHHPDILTLPHGDQGNPFHEQKKSWPTDSLLLECVQNLLEWAKNGQPQALMELKKLVDERPTKETDQPRIQHAETLTVS